MRSSSAAGAEYVSTRIEPGAASSASQAKRSTSVEVFPVPAPPTISSGPVGCVTASLWASVIATGTYVGYGGHGPRNEPGLAGRRAPRGVGDPTPAGRASHDRRARAGDR